MNKLTLLLISFFLGSAYAACSTSTIDPTAPASRFTVNEEQGVVTDHATGLMWKRCVEGFSGADCRTGSPLQTTFVGAVEHIDSINEGDGFAGFDDWRLPNVKELRSIVEEQCTRPSQNEDVFPLKNTEAADDSATLNSMVLFTSTPTSYYDADDTYVWAVSFSTGILERTSVGEYNYVRFFRLVRDAR
ncbi:hypothetical protein MGA5115_00160 [Marinomonas gallaica]|uniref:Lcl C-terminal domain-containing protein n=1 Tax=Marinomonas gallaica TaxID=1806667 RepID=A0A1C3JLQ1_9GAMM|nr:DUF1566 domain-containing protein [Marinomonas gallaica]SBT16086.1 hypothetical protein MGA5115_00160 [Marinomonas gallaica]SBT21134.1 hypothetical protein MGA5116_01721 [Marinomonas gallaica]